MNAPLSNAVATHNALREKLKAEFGLEDDDQALIDTLDGISDLKELIAYAARQARYEEAQCEACKSLIAAMQERMRRRGEKAETLRAAIIVAMEAAGEKKIDAADTTISIRPGKKKLIIDRAATAGDYLRGFAYEEIVYLWDNEILANKIDSFDQTAMEIAHWSTPKPVLTLRGK